MVGVFPVVYGTEADEGRPSENSKPFANCDSKHVNGGKTCERTHMKGVFRMSELIVSISVQYTFVSVH